MHVVIFEDTHWDTFAPLALSRPTFMLPSGTGTMLDRQIEVHSPSRLTLWVRPQLAEFCKTQVAPKLKIPTAVNQPLNDEPVLLTAGRTLQLEKVDPSHEPTIVLQDGDSVRFAYVKNMAGLSAADVMQRSPRWLKLLELPRTTPSARFADHAWELVALNQEMLNSDYARWKGKTEPVPTGPWHLVNPENVAIAREVKLSPGCVMDGSHGPIVLDVGATIGANAVLEGPCYIGQYAQIQPLSHIRPGTSIGMMCKIGGEVSNSIVSPYTNKAHYGYLGDSFVGSWVNLGAGTTTSNLKNTYGEVSMKIGSREHKTGRRNLGSIIGDHTKTAIGTRLNTGSYVGYCCLLAGQGLTPKFTPSFSFWTQDGTEKYEINKAIEVATRMFGRRDKEFGADEQAIMCYVQEIAATVEK